ncbi:MAG: glutathione-dependent disulfide-bond oxidoreductase [Paracoccaceae bacterium]
MKKIPEYFPPDVWSWKKESGGEFSKINRPTSGKTHDQALPTGTHPLQLYSLATPNGVKVTIFLEELLANGYLEAEYDAWLIKINGMQFSSGFVDINPNSKIPALVDQTTTQPTRVFESGAILLYLAEKFKFMIPTSSSKKAECLSWLFWQMGSAPYLGGGFGHFYKYAPKKIEYPINRYTMEVKRQLDVLNNNLKERKYIAGPMYTISDIAIWAWYGQLVLGKLYNASDFLEVGSYRNIIEWANRIYERPSVKRGLMVNKTSGNLEEQVKERHSSQDFDGKKLSTSE